MVSHNSEPPILPPVEVAGYAPHGALRADHERPARIPSDSFRRTGDSYRYDNLALAANSYRLVGGLLKAVGSLIIACGPLLLVVGTNSDAIRGSCPSAHTFCSSDELVGGLNQVSGGFMWPLGTVMLTLVIGVPLVIHGIAQAAQGEGLLALADIAVATTSIGNEQALALWADRRRVSSFAVLVFMAFVALVGLVIVSGTMSVTIARGSRNMAHRAQAEDVQTGETPGPTMALDPFLLSIADTNKKAHAMKIAIAIEFEATESEEGLKVLVPGIRDVVLSFLRTVTYEESMDSASVGKIRSELVSRLRSSIAPSARHVLITDLVVQ